MLLQVRITLHFLVLGTFGITGNGIADGKVLKIYGDFSVIVHVS